MVKITKPQYKSLLHPRWVLWPRKYSWEVHITDGRNKQVTTLFLQKLLLEIGS